MSLTPWWSAYLVFAVVCFVWAGRLMRDDGAREGDDDLDPLLRPMEGDE